MSDTKKSILLSALGLFARDGYEAVPVSAIAGELGITKGALYKHYKNKRDIFDSILSRMERHDAERANEFQMPTGSVSNMEEEYLRVTVDRLVEYCKAQLRYWTQDSFASSFRRMLTSPVLWAMLRIFSAASDTPTLWKKPWASMGLCS